MQTAHFRLTYPETLEAIVPRAAVAAERAFALLSEGFVAVPTGRIDLLLSDHTDISNGFARVTPSNRITIWLHPPLDGLALSHFDEWLELVITHEVVHVFHLEYTGPIGRTLRMVFGRPPLRWPYFGGYTLPRLAIEGVAVELESRLTSAGRAHGTLFDAMVRSRVLEEGPEALASGLSSSPLWPGGERPYVYGGLLFEYLSETYGADAVSNFLRAVADQWIPYRLDAAARDAFGLSFGRLWEAWMTEVEGAARAIRNRVAQEDRPTVERLTQGARNGFHPSVDPRGRGVAYLRGDGRSDLRLVLWSEDGEQTVTRWNSVHSPPRWTLDGALLLTDLEYLDRYRVQRDLYRVTVDGEVTRLTRGLRVVHADPHPRGEGMVATLGGDGTTSLVRLSNDGRPETVLREAAEGVHWSYPVWSPDGDRVAVIRRRPGGWSALLIMDAEGALVDEVVEDRHLNVAPAWASQGSALVWSSDRSGTPNLFGVTWAPEGPGDSATGEPGEVRQITDLATAGTFPSVDPAGVWIYFSLLGSDGWEVARLPFEPESWFRPNPETPPSPTVAGGTDSDPAGGAATLPADVALEDSRSYSAWPTLFPRYWLPIVAQPWEVADRRVLPRGWGFETSGSDVVGRHTYAIRATAPLSSPGRRVEWAARYRWAGLGNPVFTLESGQLWEGRGLLVSPGEMGAPPDSLLPIQRERYVGIGLEVRSQQVRRTASLALGARHVTREGRLLELDGRESEDFRFVRPSTDLLEARGALTLTTARAHAFSVSTEAGATATLALRERWDYAAPDSLTGVPGGDGGLREAVGSVRLFHGVRGPGYANHVLAFRLGAGAARGPGAGAGHFSVGGTSGPFAARGYDGGTLYGDRAWSLAMEWRFPLGILDWGAGSWPLYLDRLAGGLFLDAAGARSGEVGGWNTIHSVGAELVLTQSFFWEGLGRWAAGVAVPLEDLGAVAAYLRTGWSF
ncbi:MAG: hypothetical protein WD056_00855 [Gemmatimonadota bacterium]